MFPAGDSVVRDGFGALGDHVFGSVRRRKNHGNSRPHRRTMHAQLPAQGIEDEPEGITRMMIMIKGVTGGPSGPSREGPGVGHRIVSDTKQMTKERKKRNKSNPPIGSFSKSEEQRIETNKFEWEKNEKLSQVVPIMRHIIVMPRH